VAQSPSRASSLPLRPAALVEFEVHNQAAVKSPANATKLQSAETLADCLH
jgi:hypothetical protein